MRHPVYLGLRADKHAGDVVREREKPAVAKGRRDRPRECAPDDKLRDIRDLAVADAFRVSVSKVTAAVCDKLTLSRRSILKQGGKKMNTDSRVLDEEELAAIAGGRVWLDPIGEHWSFKLPGIVMGGYYGYDGTSGSYVVAGGVTMNSNSTSSIYVHPH